MTAAAAATATAGDSPSDRTFCVMENRMKGDRRRDSRKGEDAADAEADAEGRW